MAIGTVRRLSEVFTRKMGHTLTGAGLAVALVGCATAAAAIAGGPHAVPFLTQHPALNGLADIKSVLTGGSLAEFTRSAAQNLHHLAEHVRAIGGSIKQVQSVVQDQKSGAAAAGALATTTAGLGVMGLGMTAGKLSDMLGKVGDRIHLSRQREAARAPAEGPETDQGMSLS